ncbi:hypothetical protein [Streptomyces sp. NBC_00859]|uniref:hypothetical protein n=1 Tax=Streptomyces sp. NBC_00859 TaxID=2903682 RepID=UPI00386EDFB8|nr:hypothetical protein OG584_18215 [Streptomyces sp. NBC_00859]
MTEGRGRQKLTAEVEAVLTAVMANASVLNLSPPGPAEGVLITSFDAADARSWQELLKDLTHQLRDLGWLVDEEHQVDTNPAVHATFLGAGGGVFGVQATAISFNGPGEQFTGAEEEEAVGMTVADANRAVSADMRAAIKAATSKRVYPDDEFEDLSVRIAGWNPEETRSNDVLLKKSTAYLAQHGWKIFPETTDSDDRSALVFKPGTADGRLNASNQGLTFVGRLDV